MAVGCCTQGIAKDMQHYVNAHFQRSLYCFLDAFQINTVHLPDNFEAAIQESLNTKQNITRNERYKENMQVTFATQRMVAEQSANQTVITARGEASRKLQQANAKIEQLSTLMVVNA